jgi:Caspase domain
MRRALVVGIDHYASAPLQGCVADAVSVADVLSSNADGSRDWSVDLLVSTEDGGCTITRDVLRGRLTKLFANPRDTDLLFYFAGHGAQSPWGADLVTQDFKTHSLGVSMNDALTLANARARAASL